MGNVVIDMSMSLDGYIAAPNDNPQQGAVIMGRRTYDNSIEAWGGKGPLDDVACFVVTHRAFEPASPVFTVVTDGIEGALALARDAAGDKRIGLMGANLDQQFLAAGLVDETGSTSSMSCSVAGVGCSTSSRSGSSWNGPGSARPTA